MAADLRKETDVEVEVVDGHYGEFKVLVDDEKIVDGGKLAFLGVLPSVGTVRDKVKEAESKPEKG